MMTKTIHLRGRALVCGFLVLLALAFAGTAVAATTLKDVGYTTLPGGRVELSITFTGNAVPQPKIFTTSEPPRIAVDFPDTTNAVARRHIAIGVGATSGVSVVSAGGRTRLVVDLLRPASYTSHVEGNMLTLVISNGENVSTGTRAATINPTKVLPAQPGSAVVSRIGFRRGPHGAARVLINYTGTGLQSRIQQNDGSVVVHLDGVRVPDKLAKRLDVMDFATPVQTIDTKPGRNGGATLTLAVNGPVTTASYKADHKLVIEVSKQAKKPEQNIIGAEKKKVYTGQHVTFNFQNISVRAVLQLIAEQAHLNIVAADSVSGSITLHLVNVPWDQVLDVVLRAKGLAKRRDGNVIWIAPQKQLAAYEQRVADARMKAANTVKLVDAYIPISYGKAKDIAALLTTGAKSSNGGGSSNNRGFLSPRGSVSFDQRTNTLLIHDTPERVRDIRNLVAKLDRPVRQVLIQARIVAATNSFTRDLGVKWGVQAWQTTDSGHRIVTGATAQNAGQMGVDLHNGDDVTMQLGAGGYNVNLPITTPAGSAAIAILGANYLVDLELQAAQAEGRTEIISNQRVVTANQQPADIQKGQQVGYVTYRQGTAAGGLGTATVQFKNIVLELKVTPTITADKRVFLKIDVTKDTLDGFVDNPGGGQVPLIGHRSLTTSVLVDNGQTVVLGGVDETSKSNNVTKVPWLGDIPVLGYLFRKTDKANNKTQMLIFVTPRILTDTGS